MLKKRGYIITDFGEPEEKKEISSFIEEVTKDEAPKIPFYKFLNFWFFKLLIKRKFKKTLKPGKERKNKLKDFCFALSKILESPVLFFSRYNVKSHASFFELFRKSDVDEWIVFPLQPQFSYFFHGNTVKFFEKALEKKEFLKLFFIKSYPANKNYIRTTQEMISNFLKDRSLKETETIFFFIAPSTPKILQEEGDLLDYETSLSTEEILKAFPFAHGRMAYCEGFFNYEWLMPSAQKMLKNIMNWKMNRKNILFIPTSFSPFLNSIIERELFKEAEKENLRPFLLSSTLNSENQVRAAIEIIGEKNYLNGRMLLPPKLRF